jgi:tripartite-type tricarboxylate transporter receptor subunit TctC
MKYMSGMAAVLVLGAATSATLAQGYPTKPIRMMIGFPPGGGTDIIGRIVAQKLGDALGQQVIVDNRGGASEQLAAELVSKSAPDGYTIMMAHIAAISILPSLVAKLPYDSQRDFAPVSLSAIGPNILVVHPSVPAKNVMELVALAKSRPGQLQYASPGSGTVQHLAGELFKLQAKVDMLHVPYKGSGQSIVDLVAGQVHMDFDAVPPVINYVRQGKLRALAVTSAKRFSLLPDMPTIEESGVPGFDMSTWWGIVVPASVSKDIVAKLNSEMVKSIRQADAREKISGVGADVVGNSPEEFAAFIRAETEKYARIVKAANIKLE